jgi:hypothetical protein
MISLQIIGGLRRVSEHLVESTGRVLYTDLEENQPSL